MASVHIKVLPSIGRDPQSLVWAHQKLKLIMEDVVQDTPSRTFVKVWFGGWNPRKFEPVEAAEYIHGLWAAVPDLTLRANRNRQLPVGP